MTSMSLFTDIENIQANGTNWLPVQMISSSKMPASQGCSATQLRLRCISPDPLPSVLQYLPALCRG